MGGGETWGQEQSSHLWTPTAVVFRRVKLPPDHGHLAMSEGIFLVPAKGSGWQAKDAKYPSLGGIPQPPRAAVPQWRKPTCQSGSKPASDSDLSLGTHTHLKALLQQKTRPWFLLGTEGHWLRSLHISSSVMGLRPNCLNSNPNTTDMCHLFSLCLSFLLWKMGTPTS